ncbi:MAG TPA: bifunctional acetate--CoA ligase family protein/GNAT family N-acetyltransferase [Acidobacteriaceae bacterium]|jgi:acetyltransferase|nr:bifunctional acetate--CoA ligase family protein/GNAT family N-acetyltransferase [Acidobacteriaceae bacterium]
MASSAVAAPDRPVIIDPAHDLVGIRRSPLDTIFTPKSVAVIGASERPGSVGCTVLTNLAANSFGGPVWPVNPKRPTVLGLPAYKSIADLPGVPDLIVVTTPASSVPGIIEEGVAAGVPSAIVISAGFKEVGEAGKELERQIAATIHRKMRLIGPNCLGIMNPTGGLNATFAKAMVSPGRLAFISQSGALGTAILDWCIRERVGLSGFVSAGSMLDVTFGELIDHYGQDPNTDSIVIYSESIGDARSFLSAAREVALNKPILIIKAGRTAAAAKAAASHTGSLTGSDDVLDAAFERAGVLRVNSISEMFYVAEVLAKQPRPKGPSLTILTNAGGPGVLATDALISAGGELTEISAETVATYNAFLPDAWSHNNPVDILGDAEADRYAQALEIASKDANTHGMLVILTPQGMTDPTEIAKKLAPYAEGVGKPVIASWMGGDGVAEGETILKRAGIPVFPYPDAAAQAFVATWKHTSHLRDLYETPSARSGSALDTNRLLANSIVERVRAGRRTILTEFESKQLLAAYGIPTVRTELARTSDEAVQRAAEIGYPVVLKLHSETITHKTDVGGVKLNLRNASDVAAAFEEIRVSVTAKCGAAHFLGVTVQPFAKLDGYELIIGSSIDPQLGPVLLFGTGGQLVEVYKDRALALPPLTGTLARHQMEKTKIFKALQGVRGRRPVDLKALESLVVRFSELVVEQRWIREIDINPLLASPDGLIALDARVVLHEPETTEDQLPRPAIRPYPVQYAAPWKTKAGADVVIRPIRPEDEPLIVAFHDRLSERTVIERYFTSLDLNARTAHERLTRICFIDYDRELALVAETRGPNGAAIGGVSRMVRGDHGIAATLAVVISDDCQGQGLGEELMRRTLAAARAEGIREVVTHFLPENQRMRKLARKLGFALLEEKDLVRGAIVF